MNYLFSLYLPFNCEPFLRRATARGGRVCVKYLFVYYLSIHCLKSEFTLKLPLQRAYLPPIPTLHPARIPLTSPPHIPPTRQTLPHLPTPTSRPPARISLTYPPRIPPTRHNLPHLPTPHSTHLTVSYSPPAVKADVKPPATTTAITTTVSF